MEGDGQQAEQSQIASDVGRQLSQGRHNKDSLVKLLKQAATSLAKLQQCTSLTDALVPLSNSLVQRNTLHHKDKDVQLFVAVCLSEIIRILAPQTPFNDKVLKDIFKLIVDCFAELGDISSPYFTRRVKILQTVAAVKCCVLMLDIGCDSLVVEMFNVFFSVIRDDHQPSLNRAFLSIMSQIIEENASASIVDIILRNLLKDKKRDSLAPCNLAVAVIQNCAEKLEPFICGQLISCILERDAAEFELKEFYHEIIFMIFQYSPQILSSVIPKLALELVTDQVDVRMKAVQLVGKLFAKSELQAAVEYRPLFVEFLKRFSDKSTEVRMRAIECAQPCYMSNSLSTAALEILNALEERLLDTDDKVRTQAVSLVCDLASCNFISFRPALILCAADRLRDKKVTVRRKAMEKLLELYRAYCKRCFEGLLPFTGEFEQIPSRIIALCFDKDCKEFRPESMELILAEDLFPANLSIKERANHWIALFSFFSVKHKRALSCILAQKHRLQVEMQGYLSLREDKADFSEGAKEKSSSSLMKTATSFLDVSKAENFLQRLHQMKDDCIFKTLLDLINMTTFETLQSTRDSFLQRIGDKHPDFEYFRILSLKCSHSIFTSEHVQCFLEIFFSRQSSGDEHGETVFDLLSIVVCIFPSLLRGSERSFLNLFTEIACLSNEKLLPLLTRGIRHVSISLSDVNPFLKQICLQGTRSQSKVAISAIAALDDAAVQPIFCDLSQKLLGSLCSGQNLPTVLQSLGCLANHSTYVSESVEEQIIKCIFDKMFSSSRGKSSELKIPTKSISASSDFCDLKLKVYGLRALVKIFLAPRITHARCWIGDLLDILLKILKEDDPEDTNPSCNDLAPLRLASAKAVLYLSSRWDLYISPQLFHHTILISKAASPYASKFLNKVRNLLNRHAIPNRYACAYPVAASYGQGDIQSDSEKYLAEFVKKCGSKSQNSQISDDEGAMKDHPEYLVVFLIHTLANDQSFPSVECEDAEVFALSCWPLIILLQTIIRFFADECERNLNDVASNLVGIFRAIKKAEDAINSFNTTKLQMLSHIGALAVKHLCRDLNPAVSAPRMIFLPSSLYRVNLGSQLNKSEYIRKEFLCERFVERMIKFRSPTQVNTDDQGFMESNIDTPLSDVDKNLTSGFMMEKLAASVTNEPIVDKENCHDPTVDIPDGSTRSVRSRQNSNKVPSSEHAQYVKYGYRIRKCNDGELGKSKVNMEGEVPSRKRSCSRR